MTCYHISTNIEGLLQNCKHKKINFMVDDNGRPMTDKEARAEIARLQKLGHKLIGPANCEGFDPFGGGCPGHEKEKQMSKHTPGPWKIIPGFSKMKVYGGEKHQGHFCIADCHQFDIANDQDAATIEKEANARLIAAAPQMLDALEALVSNHGGLSDENYSIAKAAIAAAKGE